MADCPNREANTAQCTCPAEDCDRRGLCCACIEYHRSGGSLPSCVRELAQKKD